MSGLSLFKRFGKNRRGKDLYGILCLSIVLIFTVGAAGVLWGCSKNGKMPGYEKAWEIVKKEILKDKPENKIVYVYEKILPSGFEIKSWGTTHTVPKEFPEAWFFFIDEQPDANWGHRCKYVFVNIETGKYSVIESTNPPDSMDGMKMIYPPSS